MKKVLSLKTWFSVLELDTVKSKNSKFFRYGDVSLRKP